MQTSVLRAQSASPSVALSGRGTTEFAEILTPDALEFIAKLHRRFEPRRQELLARRAARQAEFDRGALPDFLAETKKLRDAEWTIAPQPKDMLDRRGEDTHPARTPIVDHALHSR